MDKSKVAWYFMAHGLAIHCDQWSEIMCSYHYTYTITAITNDIKQIDEI